MAGAVIIVVFSIAITNFNTQFFFQNLIHSLRFILKIFIFFNFNLDVLIKYILIKKSVGEDLI